MAVISARSISVSVPGRIILGSLDLDIEAGECVAVTGRSGSGKTTLLHCLAGVSVPDSGEIVIDGTRIDQLSAAKRARFRLSGVGLVFQFGELLPALNVLENTSLPARLAGQKGPAADQRARELLARVGMAGAERQETTSLSGGEVQRVAIARALVNRPSIVLADEPTGALDDRNGAVVGHLLVDTARTENAAVVIATHDQSMAALADRSLALHAGTEAVA